ncbi:hypothetical protein GCM10025857_08510 [Alicyclobacillus contaminans]|nr:hypothetical protein GCM10025857_08510 [Alicyclobacillus contaminans]
MRKRWKGIWYPLLAVAFVIATGCGVDDGGNRMAKETSVRPLPPPVSDHGMTLVWGNDVKTQALAMIRGSQKYCYLDMYELSDPDIIQALIAAHERGTDVRVVLDATESNSQHVGLPMLKRAGVPVESQRIHRGISHIKMLLADGADGGVLIGGMNFGEHSWDNNDASVHMPMANPSFLAVFHWDWQRAQGEPAEAPSAQMPLLNERTVERHVVDAINEAQSTVYLEAFNLSDWAVLNALTAASRRGSPWRCC